MEGGPPSFTPDFSGRALLRNSTSQRASSSPTGLSPSLAPRSRGLPLTSLLPSVGPTTPTPQGRRFRLRPVRSPLLRASRLISLPPGTEMFQFPGFASLRRVMTRLAPRRVAPFGHPGISACVPLPQAYRSLPRPSSPPCAQASPTCLRSLDYFAIVSSRARAIGLQSPIGAPIRRQLAPASAHVPRRIHTQRSPQSFAFQTASPPTLRPCGRVLNCNPSRDICQPARVVPNRCQVTGGSA